MDHGEVVARTFLEPGSHGTRALEIVKAYFDEVSAPIEFPIEPSAVVLSSGAAGNYDLHALAPHLANESIAVVATVCEQCVSLSMIEQLIGLGHFVAVTLRERDVERAAFGVDDGVDFG